MKQRLASLLIPLATLSVACVHTVPDCADANCTAEEGGGGSEPIDECEHLETRSCDVDGLPGLQRCEPAEDGYIWGDCAAESSTASTPLVLSFDNTPVQFGHEASASFDLSGTANCQGTNWPSATTPWLALDRDGSKTIDDGAELFGSMTRLSTGLRAKNGFMALRELDSNRDGKISAADDAFGRLQLWADADGNRLSSAGETRSLASAGIVSIQLDYEIVPRCDERGNCERERASFSYRDANGNVQQGSIVDVHLRHQ